MVGESGPDRSTMGVQPGGCTVSEKGSSLPSSRLWQARLAAISWKSYLLRSVKGPGNRNGNLISASKPLLKFSRAHQAPDDEAAKMEDTNKLSCCPAGTIRPVNYRVVGGLHTTASKSTYREQRFTLTCAHVLFTRYGTFTATIAVCRGKSVCLCSGPPAVLVQQPSIVV